MTIKPVLVPDHDAAALRGLMDRFAEAATGPTRQQLAESRAAVAAAQGVAEGAFDIFKKLPPSGSTVKIDGRPVKISYGSHGGEDNSHVNFSWNDTNGKEHYVEARVETIPNLRALAKRIKGEMDWVEQQNAAQGVAEATGQQLNIQQLATISDEALDNAYHYGRSTPGNTFGWQANLKSAAYAKQMIDQGVTDIEAISDAIHKGWNVTARAFVQNPEQFSDTEKLQAAGKLEAKLQQRTKLMNIGYSQLPDEEQEKDRVVARALLQALKGKQGVAEGGMPSSVIKSKQRYGDMSDKDFAELHQSKADDDLVAMAWRHGYGKGSLHYVNKRKRGKEGVAEGGEKYKVKSIGHDAKGDYYISPSTGKKVYKSGVKRGDHENPNTGEIKKNIAEAPGDFGLGANYRAVPDAEMQDLMGRSKNKTKTKRDKFDYPYIHGSNIQVKDEGGKTFDAEALKKSIMVRPGRILGQNAKMQHSETGTEAIFDIGLPALKGLAVNEKTGEFVVVDTCPGAGACKTFCYAMKGSYVMFKAVSMGLARMLNFLLNDPEGFASQLNAEIAAAKSKMAKKNAKVVVRWHDAGDFFSAEYLDMAYGVANANPDVGFYAYTKMADVATGQRPKNFNMNFSGGAVSSQEKKIDFQRVKHSKVVPKDMFFDLIARDGTSLKKDAKGRMQFASPENLDQFKSIMAQKYAIDKNSILTYDEMMKTPVGDKPKWNTIVMPGDGDNSANRNDVVGSYLLFH